MQKVNIFLQWIVIEVSSSVTGGLPFLQPFQLICSVNSFTKGRKPSIKKTSTEDKPNLKISRSSVFYIPQNWN